MDTVLVTGGAGFIGHHLVRKLIAEEYTVVVVDNLSTGKRERLPDGVTLELIDIRNKEEVESVMDKYKPKHVYHLAALPRIQKSWDNPEDTYAVNVTGTFNVLEAARKAQVGRILVTSSSSVYAGHSIGTRPQAIELAYYWPLNPYAWQKVFVENLAKMYVDLYDMDVRVVRPFNVYGEGQSATDEYATLIPIFANQKRKGLPLTVFGNGRQTRDFVYVGDVVNIMHQFLNDEDVMTHSINISANNPVSVKEVAEAFDCEIQYVPNPRHSDAEWTWGWGPYKAETSIIEWINSKGYEQEQ